MAVWTAQCECVCVCILLILRLFLRFSHENFDTIGGNRLLCVSARVRFSPREQILDIFSFFFILSFRIQPAVGAGCCCHRKLVHFEFI